MSKYSIKNKDPFEPIRIQEIKTAWVVISDSGLPFNWSIAHSRKDCISAFAFGLGEKNVGDAWDRAKKRGHMAIKVKITFDPI